MAKLRKPRGKWLTDSTHIGLAENIHGDNFAVHLQVMGGDAILSPRRARQVANRLIEFADWVDQQGASP